MHEKRIWNILLVLVAALLLLNLGVMLSPSVRAIPTTQYKAIRVELGNVDSPSYIQQALDRQSAAGWEYVGQAGSSTLIFKK